MKKTFIRNIEEAIGFHWLVRWGLESLEGKETEKNKCSFEAEHNGDKAVITISADTENPDTVTVNYINKKKSDTEVIPIEELQTLLVFVVEDTILRKF